MIERTFDDWLLNVAQLTDDPAGEFIREFRDKRRSDVRDNRVIVELAWPHDLRGANGPPHDGVWRAWRRYLTWRDKRWRRMT